MIHPGRYLANQLKERSRTQKQFADLIGKKVSEVNELINGKRNITIQWDIILSLIFDDTERKRINLQNDYDYYIAKMKIDKKRLEDITKRKNQLQKEHVFTQF